MIGRGGFFHLRCLAGISEEGRGGEACAMPAASLFRTEEETHASLSFPYGQWRKSGEEAFYLSSSRKGRGMRNFRSSPCIGFSNFELSLIVSCLGAAVLIHSFAHVGLFFLVTRGLKASFLRFLFLRFRVLFVSFLLLSPRPFFSPPSPDSRKHT